MKTVSLSGSIRQGVGKKDAAALRRDGRVPSVLYGGKQQIHFHISAIDFKKLIYSPDVFEVQLEIDGSTHRSIIKDIQFHPVTDRPLHVDFLQMFEDKEISVDLPVRAVGSSIGVVNGGRLAVNFRNLTVKGLPNALPECIETDITLLKIGQDIRVRDLTIDGCEIEQPQSAVVVAIKMTRASMGVDEEEEEGTESEGGGEDAPAEAAEE